MTRWIGLALLAALLAGGGAALAQQQDRVVVQGEATTAAEVVSYGGEEFELDPADGTIAIGFVDKAINASGGTELVVLLFVHDELGWRATGPLFGDATGLLEGAAYGDVLTLTVIEGGQ